ncbi:LysR family transcriptional regulator [Bradyrhizobium guangzhouense]|uniref:LysR family transcriptional regulator n=1 Tax=Bradyrhizobium guangzhouense TaxID=1325095 RepID=UPI001009E54F|nr:LysR family transcriptional regulator [Bradyrhizobium guangzhouense]RXH10635.1 LysR family transcriptional regulator [Bradyrhizobium guangzhouense]
MDLRQLRYFVTVANERNFSRAADRLHIAQPPLSRQIQQLEAEVGAQLIDRSSRPLRLTEPGRLFYEQSIQVLARVEEMRTMMKRTLKIEKRRFVIGFVGSVLYGHLPELIREFRRAAPEVELHLVELVTLEQIAALKEGRIDIGFGRVRFDDDEVRRIILREEQLVVALPMDHPLEKQSGPVSLEQLAEERLILYPRAPRPGYADQVIALFHDRGLEPRVAHEARELQIAVGLVAAEEGACIVPVSVQKSRVEGVRYKRLAEPATSPIIMSHRQGDKMPELGVMADVIARMYQIWGYDVSDALLRFDL